MAMDFFESQDVARRKTGRLVLLFVLAVIAIVAMVYVVFAVALGAGHAKMAAASGAQTATAFEPWNPMLLLWVTAGTVALVTAGSLYKINLLSAGGRIVAESLDGRRIDADAPDPQQRRLLNVVQEMAIASGTPVPPVYMIEEAGINAFAAGYSIDDAVIGVTRGAVETLSRDELQGVIAHEFSHILNGDMRLNIRLMGIIHGILVIGIVGYYLMRSAAYSGGRSRSSRGNSAAAMIMIGLAVMIIGYVGTLFGNLIKAAVSRQREFLADASSVQFTRNPDGIAGALKKIGGWKNGSRLENPNAPEMSHLLFGSGIKSSFGSLFATHPPLIDRITRIDPSFKGKFPRTTPLAPGAGDAAGVSGFAQQAEAAPAADGIAQIGRPTQAHLDYATHLIESLPERIAAVAHEPFGARALIYAMVIDKEAEPRQHQLERLRQFADAGVRKEFEALLPLVEQLDPAARLPLVDLTIPALRELSPGQYGAFKANLDVLVRADDQIDLFEWTLHRILLKHLDAQFQPVRRPPVRYKSLTPLVGECASLLSTLAYIGTHDHAKAADAFLQAAAKLQLSGLTLQPVEACGLDAVSEALDKLRGLSPRFAARSVRRLLEACATCISADGQITVREAELFRALGDSLDCPMPPLLPGQPLSSRR